MKKYAVIGIEILLSIILIVVIVFLAIRITGNNNSKDIQEADNKSIQTTQEMAKETVSTKSEESQQSSINNESQEESTEMITEAVTEAVTEEPVQVEEPVKEADNIQTANIIDMDKLNDLVSENIFMISSVFNGSPTILSNEKSGTYIKVNTNVFADYADFKNRVYSVYTKEQADYYISTGYPGYTDVNGDLYFDTNYMAGGGYYVIWDGYTITVNDNSDNECSFTVNVKYQGPSTFNVLTDYYINGNAVYEEGRWVLTKMLRD